MAFTYTKYLTITAGQDVTINMSDLYPPDIDPITNITRVYEQNWVIVNVSRDQTTSPTPNLPNWAEITQLGFISSLPYDLRNMTFIYAYAINNNKYLKEIKVNIPSQGNYYLRCHQFSINNGAEVYNFFNIHFNVVVPPPPPPPIPEPIKNPQGIQYNTYDRVIRVEKNVATNKSFGTDGLYPNGEEIIISSTLPAWITNNTINSRTQTWDITAPSVNTYYYYGNVYLRNEFKGSATITLQVVESLFEEVDNCCSDENINIVWLNRQGGRGNFIFTQRRDYKVNIGDKKTYITKDIKRYSEINKVYNAVTVYATGLSLNQIDFLDTLRYSIQAWVFVNEVFIPIILDVESFDKYNTKENMYDISITFNYAEQLNIQRQ
jgi:hypothetical protein